MGYRIVAFHPSGICRIFSTVQRAEAPALFIDRGRMMAGRCPDGRQTGPICRASGPACCLLGWAVAGPSGPQVVCRASGPASVFMCAGLCERARVRAFGVRGCVRACEWTREGL